MLYKSLNQAALNINDKSVVHIILEQPLHGCVDVVNANILNLTSDVVLAAEVQHLLGLLDASNGAATNPETACVNHTTFSICSTLIAQTISHIVHAFKR